MLTTECLKLRLHAIRGDISIHPERSRRANCETCFRYRKNLEDFVASWRTLPTACREADAGWKARRRRESFELKSGADLLTFQCDWGQILTTKTGHYRATRSSIDGRT